VLAPTRELALQIAEHFAMLGGARGLRTVTLIGGEPMGPQLAGLARRPDVIVATPGRLFDHIERRSATLSSVRIVVLDEADRMLDMGFAPQVERILAVTPLDRQTLCFSATMPEEVERLVRKHLSRPERVEVGTVAKPVAAVTQRLYATDSGQKMPLLLQLLGAERGQTLVFTRTKHRADRLARAVAAAGHRVTRLHADRTMSQRREALDGFRAGRYRVLVATDIAARGIDVPEISHVVNFDLPHTPEDYNPPHRPHRACRGDRAGDELRRARGTGPVARDRAASRPPRAAELKQKLATTDHDGRINKGRNDAPEDSRDGNRYREVVQRREGLRLHHAGGWRGRLRALQRDPGAGLQEPRRG